MRHAMLTWRTERIGASVKDTEAIFAALVGATLYPVTVVRQTDILSLFTVVLAETEFSWRTDNSSTAGRLAEAINTLMVERAADLSTAGDALPITAKLIDLTVSADAGIREALYAIADRSFRAAGDDAVIGDALLLPTSEARFALNPLTGINAGAGGWIAKLSEATLL